MAKKTISVGETPVAPAGTPAASRRSSGIPADLVGKLTFLGGSKRGKSAERFAIYRTAKTTADYVNGCMAIGYSASKAVLDLRWDLERGFISIVKE